jgi:hypothetical protein
MEGKYKIELKIVNTKGRILKGLEIRKFINIYLNINKFPICSILPSKIQGAKLF